MQNERATVSTGRLAPLAQVALAALVAGSLLTFSTIAFRTAFDEPSQGRGVTVSSPRTDPAAPVVLPTPPRATDGSADETADVVAEVVAPDAPNIIVDRNDGQEPRSRSKGEDDEEVSEPRVVLPDTDGDRGLSGVVREDHDDDDDNDDKNKSKHGKRKGHGAKDKGHGPNDRGHGHKKHGHKGHRHPRGRKN